MAVDLCQSCVPRPCEVHTNDTTCPDDICSWNSTLSYCANLDGWVPCYKRTTEALCDDAGEECTWESSVCRNTYDACADQTTDTDCTNYGSGQCVWYGGSCFVQFRPPACKEITTAQTCIEVGDCTWNFISQQCVDESDNSFCTAMTTNQAACELFSDDCLFIDTIGCIPIDICLHPFSGPPPISFDILFLNEEYWVPEIESGELDTGIDGYPQFAVWDKNNMNFSSTTGLVFRGACLSTPHFTPLAMSSGGIAMVHAYFPDLETNNDTEVVFDLSDEDSVVMLTKGPGNRLSIIGRNNGVTALAQIDGALTPTVDLYFLVANSHIVVFLNETMILTHPWAGGLDGVDGDLRIGCSMTNDHTLTADIDEIWLSNLVPPAVEAMLEYLPTMEPDVTTLTQVPDGSGFPWDG